MTSTNRKKRNSLVRLQISAWVDWDGVYGYGKAMFLASFLLLVAPLYGVREMKRECMAEKPLSGQ